MTNGGRLKLFSGGWLILACVVAGPGLTFHSPSSAQASAGSIAGRVWDPSGTLVPGVTIKAIRQEDGNVIQAITGESGSYVLLSLQSGSFVITAELAGFKEATQGPITVRAGDIISVDFRLRLAALDHVDYVQMYNTLDDLAANSEVIAHLIIGNIDSATEWEIGPDSSAMGIVITARVIERLKSHGTHGPSEVQFQFLHFGSYTPYRPGQEYIAFLNWNENVRHFEGLAGYIYMIEVAHSHVTKTTSLEGVRVGMPVSRLLERIRALVKPLSSVILLQTARPDPGGHGIIGSGKHAYSG